MTLSNTPLTSEALDRARWAARHRGLHLSKTTIRTFGACPQAYLWEKVERRPGSLPLSLALARGTIVHAAVEVALKHVNDPDWEARAEEVLSQVRELEDEVPVLLSWVRAGRDYVLGQGGQITYVEDFASLDRGASAGFFLHARLDTVVEGGVLGGIEIIDFKTGTQCPTPPGVRFDGEAGIHRLILGGVSPIRPIHTTQLHLPSGMPVTVTLTDEEVLQAWNDVIEARDAVRDALARDDFPARPGMHCVSCRYRESCREAQR